MNWLDRLLDDNKTFTNCIDKNNLPIQRQPSRHAIITCMDPRINLNAIGIPAFSHRGEAQSKIRIIRTLGARVDDRSLLVGIHLAGIKEIAVLMHTDCGCCLAWHKTNTIIDNLKASLSAEKLNKLQIEVGRLDKPNVRKWLKAVADEVHSIKSKAYFSEDLIVHGLVYNLETAICDVVVNGYR